MAGVFTLHKQYKIYISESFDPKFNLSIEEWLMENNQPDEVVFFLWQNANTIVIGRNQNPYKECDVKKLKEDDVQLVRRLTGGGAVYHDVGNLNFTFITSDANYNLESNMKIILNGISEFGILGYFNGRNDLMVQERKFSGNAFMNENGVNCHHGTALVDVDLDKLSRYLTVSPLKLQSKGIDSVISRVVNLRELSKEITIEKLKHALIDSFNEFYNTNSQIIILNEKSVDVTKYIEKYSSWEWNYSESPDFSISFEEKFAWGIIEVCMDFSDGKITNCKIFTDSILLEDFKSLERSLQGEQFKAKNIIEDIEKCIQDNKIKADLRNLIYCKLQ